MEELNRQECIERNAFVKWLITIAIFLPLFFSYAFGQSIVVNSPNGDEVIATGSNYTIDFNAATTTNENADYNVLATYGVWYSHVQGARENAIVTNKRLYNVISPDQNSQSWVDSGEGKQNNPSYDTSDGNHIDGAGSFKNNLLKNAVSTMAFYKYVPDTNLYDIWNNDGNFVMWVKFTCAYCVATTTESIKVIFGNSERNSFAKKESIPIADTNNAWQKISFSLKSMTEYVPGTFSSQKIGVIQISIAFTDGGNPNLQQDVNAWMDGIRIYDANRAITIAFDGNTAETTNIQHAWRNTPDYNNGYIDANISITGSTNTSIQDSSNDTWNFQGLKIRVKDERSGAYQQPETFTIDGNSWLSYCTTGICTIPQTANISQGYHNIQISAPVAGYSTRDYNWNIDINTNNDINFGLVPDTNSANIDFTFYNQDKTTTANGKIVRVTDLNNHYIASQKTLSSTGETTLRLDVNSEKYGIALFNPNGTFYADYNWTKLTIKKPLDEKSPTTTITPYNINISGAIGHDSNGANTDSNYSIYSNAKIVYKIMVNDSYAAYDNRVYLLQVKGADKNALLQPYLLTLADGASLVFISKDRLLNTVAGVYIYLYKNINGVKTEVASGITDIAGNLPMIAEFGATYYLDVYYPEGTIVITTTNFIPTYSPIYLDLATGTITQYAAEPKTEILFIPAYSFLPSGTKDLNQIVITDLNVSRIRFFVDQNNNGDYNVLYDINVWWDANVNNDINYLAILANPDLNNSFAINAVIEMYDDTNTLVLTRRQVYWTAASTGNLGFIGKAVELKAYFGCKAGDVLDICWQTNMIALILALLITGSLAFFVNRMEPLSFSLMATIILGLFTMIQWYSVLLLVPMVIITLVLARSDM